MVLLLDHVGYHKNGIQFGSQTDALLILDRFYERFKLAGVLQLHPDHLRNLCLLSFLHLQSTEAVGRFLGLKRLKAFQYLIPFLNRNLDEDLLVFKNYLIFPSELMALIWFQKQSYD